MFCDCRTAGAASTNTTKSAATSCTKAARPAVVAGPRRAVAAAESVQEGPDQPTGREALRADDPHAGRGPEGAALKRRRRGVPDLGRRASSGSAEEARAAAEEALVVVRRAAAVARRAPPFLSMLSCTTDSWGMLRREKSYGAHSAAGAERAAACRTPFVIGAQYLRHRFVVRRVTSGRARADRAALRPHTLDSPTRQHHKEPWAATPSCLWTRRPSAATSSALSATVSSRDRYKQPASICSARIAS